jgi:hypothetical protein
MAKAGFLIAVRPANATGAKAEGAKNHPSNGLSSEVQPAGGRSRSFKFPPRIGFGGCGGRSRSVATANPAASSFLSPSRWGRGSRRRRTRADTLRVRFTPEACKTHDVASGTKPCHGVGLASQGEARGTAKPVTAERPARVLRRQPKLDCPVKSVQKNLIVQKILCPTVSIFSIGFPRRTFERKGLGSALKQGSNPPKDNALEVAIDHIEMAGGPG